MPDVGNKQLESRLSHCAWQVLNLVQEDCNRTSTDVLFNYYSGILSKCRSSEKGLTMSMSTQKATPSAPGNKAATLSSSLVTGTMLPCVCVVCSPTPLPHGSYPRRQLYIPVSNTESANWSQQVHVHKISPARQHYEHWLCS